MPEFNESEVKMIRYAIKSFAAEQKKIVRLNYLGERYSGQRGTSFLLAFGQSYLRSRTISAENRHNLKLGA